MATRSAEQLFYDALALQEQNALVAAETLYREALHLAPDRPSILLNLATVLIGLGRHPEAEPLLTRLLQQNQDDEDALSALGVCQSNTGGKQQALATFEQVLAINPRSVDALNGRGNVLVDLKRPQEALIDYDRALALVPDHAGTLNNRGSALLDLGRANDALDCYNHALQENPDDPTTLNNRGNALLNLNQTRAAMDSFSKAAQLRPGYARAHWNESLCRLTLGEFAAGWKLFEWGWPDGQRGPKLPLDKPWWDGYKVDGVLLAWGEQGIGDQILFAGMIHDLAPYASTLMLAVEPRLVALFRRSFPDITVIAKDMAVHQPSVTQQISLGSIGQYLRKNWLDFKRNDKYLFLNDILSNSLRERLPVKNRICGISWASRNNAAAHHKSMRLKDLHPILALEGIHAVDLQYGDTLAERQSFLEEFGISVTHLDDIDNFQNIDGLAALIGACDVVVTVSNTTAHLAGALGKPTYLMVPFCSGRHWYWHENRDDSPWYPSIRIFRQTDAGDWDPVIGQVKNVLLRQ